MKIIKIRKRIQRAVRVEVHLISGQGRILVGLSSCNVELNGLGLRLRPSESELDTQRMWHAACPYNSDIMCLTHMFALHTQNWRVIMGQDILIIWTKWKAFVLKNFKRWGEWVLICIWTYSIVFCGVLFQHFDVIKLKLRL